MTTISKTYCDGCGVRVDSALIVSVELNHSSGINVGRDRMVYHYCHDCEKVGRDAFYRRRALPKTEEENE